MGDYEKHEPKTRGEHKEEHGPEPDFPEPPDCWKANEFSQHCEDLIDASNMLGTVVALIDRREVVEARRYANSGESIMDAKIRGLMDKEIRRRVDASIEEDS